MIKQLTTTAILLALSAAQIAFAQKDQGFIYGKVTTIDNDTYEGPIRWGKEEVYWTDLFNAGKEENENIEYLSRSELNRLDRHEHRRNWGLNVHWDWDWDNDYKHQFGCQFGDLKRITVTGRDRLEIELQNGVDMELDGRGYNDVGAKIRLIDNELGEVELRWSRIDEIEFMPTPAKIDRKFGEPLFGKVETRSGTFTGFIQWDHDERVSRDKLDGDTRDGDLSIEFGRIKAIERDGSGSLVTLTSGRDLFMRGTNDVNHENKGIIVTTEFGRVDIEWREFEKVTFQEAPNSGKPYKDFAKQKALEATVKTEDGKKLNGRIVYDLDEAYDFEILHGMDDDDIEYLIPFRNIKSIQPKGYDESEVVLNNGKKLRLEESQDVSDENTGLLVFEGTKDPVYVAWDDIDEIVFN